MRSCSATTALTADLILGEPPVAMHPTVWMGSWIAERRTARRRVQRAPRRATPPIAALCDGTVAVVGGILGTALPSAALAQIVDRTPRVTRSLVRGVALKPALSLRCLIGAARDIEHALASSQLDEARRLLSWHLVSRRTAALSPSEVAGAAIESVAENLSDGVIAPLLAFRTGGLPAAYVYRFINTADAMLGYRTDELEWFGKPAARTDDLANLLPARISALLICCTAPLGNGSPRRAVQIARRDAGITSSPNAGWPMAAMAGALGVCLTKRGEYILNAGGRSPGPRDIARCCRIATAAAWSVALLCDSL